MAGVIMTSNHPKALWPGVKGWWGRTYQDHQTEYTDLFDTDTSDKAYEELVQITGFGLAPVKQQGAPAEYDSEVQGPTSRFVHVAYALGYIVTHEELKDNLYMDVSKTRATSNARAFRQTKERVCANIYNYGFTATGHNGADGVPLFSTVHPNTSGGTFSNRLAVDADLSEAAIEDMIIQIMQAQDDRGLLINLMPRCVNIAPANWFNANRILKSVYQVGNANNDINVIKATNALPEGIKLNHYFTAPAAWFIRTNVEKGKGMLYLEREAISFDQDNDFDTKNAKALGYERYSAGWVDPRAVYGSNGP
jgi:hypothetical protein